MNSLVLSSCCLVLHVRGLEYSLASGNVWREGLGWVFCLLCFAYQVIQHFIFCWWLLPAAVFKFDWCLDFFWNEIKNISCMLFLWKYWKKLMSFCWPFLPWLACVSGREIKDCFNSASTGEVSNKYFCSVTDRHMMWNDDSIVMQGTSKLILEQPLNLDVLRSAVSRF